MKNRNRMITVSAAVAAILSVTIMQPGSAEAGPFGKGWPSVSTTSLGSGR